jgi:hypothetical protein
VSPDAQQFAKNGVIADDVVMRLPVARDLPIVLASRLSLSFPVLLCPVPLLAINYATSTSDAPAKPEDCWFTDGGLSSNFPIHSFDRPLPDWPTFGLNLGSFRNKSDYDENDQSKNIWMPPDNKAGVQDTWMHFSSPFGFFSCILEAIREWQDKIMMRMPGYRDRVATVLLTDDEGGLNLDMNRTKILELADRGQAAGAELVRRFSQRSAGHFDGAMNWENQRVIRYRATMQQIQVFLDSFRKSYETASQPGDVSYDELVKMAARAGTTFRPYGWPLGGRVGPESSKQTRRLVDLSKDWHEAAIDFSAGSPRPRGKLAVRARF